MVLIFVIDFLDSNRTKIFLCTKKLVYSFVDTLVNSINCIQHAFHVCYATASMELTVFRAKYMKPFRITKKVALIRMWRFFVCWQQITAVAGIKWKGFLNKWWVLIVAISGKKIDWQMIQLKCIQSISRWSTFKLSTTFTFTRIKLYEMIFACIEYIGYCKMINLNDISKRHWLNESPIISPIIWSKQLISSLFGHNTLKSHGLCGLSDRMMLQTIVFEVADYFATE